MLKTIFLVCQIIFDIFVIVFILNEWRKRK